MPKRIVLIVCMALVTILLFHKGDADTPKKETPKTFEFSRYPNPFIKRPIKWTVPDSCHVEIIFYNVEGDVVDTFINEFQTAGFYEKEWNPEIKVEGVYFYRMVICEDTIFKKYIYLGSDTQSDTAQAIDKSDSLQDQTSQNKQEGE